MTTVHFKLHFTSENVNWKYSTDWFCSIYNCENLKSINIPKSVESIGNDVFEFCDNVTIKCYENSYAHEYHKNKRY